MALAHELFQQLKSKSRGGSVGLKIDISKAFDKLQWNFLFRALVFFQFSPIWIGLIKELVCSSKGSVLINKSPCGFFHSFCGLKQGDPLSPYLFILAEEILSINLEKLRLEGAIIRISATSSSPCHLLYADDILIFLKAHKASLRRLQGLFNLYQDSSGQRINL